MQACFGGGEIACCCVKLLLRHVGQALVGAVQAGLLHRRASV